MISTFFTMFFNLKKEKKGNQGKGLKIFCLWVFWVEKRKEKKRRDFLKISSPGRFKKKFVKNLDDILKKSKLFQM